MRWPQQANEELAAVTVVAIVQARMGSNRLPGKVLLDLAGAPMLERVVRRTEAIPGIDAVVVATSVNPADDAIQALCRTTARRCVRGDEEDVLSRFFDAATQHGADHVVRITADCPFLCSSEAGRIVAHHLATGADYSHNVTAWGSGMPLGTGTEVFTLDALARSCREGHEPHHREHVDEYVSEHPEIFRIEMLEAPPDLYHPDLRLTVDTAEDLALARAIYRALERPERLIDLAEVLELLRQRPELLALNRHVVQKWR
jgi:spore coat polysaccharide biosynthesis protein SpsF